MELSDLNGKSHPSDAAPEREAIAREFRRPASEFTLSCTYDIAAHPNATMTQNLARRIVNISEGGIGFEAFDPIPRPAALNLVIAHDASGDVLHARGNVAWSVARIVNGVTTHLVGVHFDKIYTPAARRARFLGEEKTQAPEPAPRFPESRRLRERFRIEEHVVEVVPVVPFWVLKKPANIALSVCDLSASGAQIRCTHRLTEGTKARVLIQITRFKDGIESEAQVVWARPQGPLPGATWFVGFRFVGLSPAQERHLLYMARWFTSDESRRRLHREAGQAGR